MLKCSSKSATVPKIGNSVDENEDNILEPSVLEIESINLLRFAISDGATESSFSKEWSDLLVSFYKDKSFEKEHILDTLKLVSDTWRSITNNSDLPWYAQQKAEIGSFAAFLGLTINRDEHVYNSVAVGDCTLFHIRDDKLIFAFPIKTFDEFGNTPNLIASNIKYQTKLAETVAYSNGDIQSNDVIILATDALAAWIFKQKDMDEKPWNHLADILENKIRLETWLNSERQANEIKNDDIAIIFIKLE